MNWKTVCTPKKGGLGSRPLRQMNNALLGKLLWMIGEDTNSLWRSIILAKYGLRRDGRDLDGPYTRTQAYGKELSQTRKPFSTPSDIGLALIVRFYYGRTLGRGTGR